MDELKLNHYINLTGIGGVNMDSKEVVRSCRLAQSPFIVSFVDSEIFCSIKDSHVATAQ